MARAMMRIDVPRGMSSDVAVAFVKREMFDRGYPAEYCNPAIVEHACVRNSDGYITQMVIAHDIPDKEESNDRDED